VTKISRDEFESEYARRSGVTVDQLRWYGMRAIPCECDYELCQGWQMTHYDPRRLQRPIFDTTKEGK